MIRKSIESKSSDVSKLEAIGAINYLKLDDIAVPHADGLIDPDSIVMLQIVRNMPVLPEFTRRVE